MNGGFGFLSLCGTTSTYRILSDQVGSVRFVVNTADGTVAQEIDYNSFGRVTQDTNQGFQPFGFAGGLYDSQTGLVRLGVGDYDPEFGRWTTKDPTLHIGPEPNLFGYSLEDPLNFYDPTGLATVTNDTGVPLVVSGDLGRGNGSGPQFYGVVPPNGGRYGGTGLTIGSFATLEQAQAYVAYLENPTPNKACPGEPDWTKPILDVDFYYFNGKRIKMSGDDQGPVDTIGRDGGASFTTWDYSKAVYRYAKRKARKVYDTLYWSPL